VFPNPVTCLFRHKISNVVVSQSARSRQSDSGSLTVCFDPAAAPLARTRSREMKSRKKFGSLLLWLTAAAVMTITFRMALTRTPANQKRVRHAAYSNQIEAEPSAHLVEAALRKVDFPQSLSATERAALHQPLLTPTGVTLIPDHSLFVEAVPVVEDPYLTWDPCLVKNGNPATGGNQTGAWTFNELMLAVAGTNDSDPQPAEQILTNIVADFAKDVTIGNFTAKARTGGPDFFNSWPTDLNSSCSNGPGGKCLSLKNAPVHLNAIVNRVDVGQNGNSDMAGQLRFVFGVTMDPTNTVNGGGSGNYCEGLNNLEGGGNQLFNIILEYNVPNSSLSNGFTAQTWAQAWAKLSNDCPEPNGFTQACVQDAPGSGTGIFDYDLNQIVQQVVAVGAGGPNTPNGSALADIRTNEDELDGGAAIWELRQFAFASQSGSGIQLVQTALSQTPDLSFDGATQDGVLFCTISNQDLNNPIPGCSTNLSTIETLIQDNQTSIENGTFSLAQTQNDSALEAASALNATIFWDSSPSMSSDTSLYTARAIFAASPRVSNSKTNHPDPQGGGDGTCNGCHGTETVTTFRHIVNRSATGAPTDQPSQLSGFLVGCNNGDATLTVACPELTTGCGGSQNPCVFQLNSASTEIVQDPVYGTGWNNTFGDIQRRVNCMNKILNPNSPTEVKCDGAGN
jgi:hypothetical protein